MKSIEQILFLSKNPYYPLTKQEKERLDDFLSQQQEDTTKKSQKKSSKRSENKTRVRVRNVVKKTDTGVPEATESSQNPSSQEKR